MHLATVPKWLAKISEASVRRRAEIYYQQLDVLVALRQEVRRELLAESRKHPAMRLLWQIPSIGPIRAALLIALMQTPHRFRSKRQLWAYCGLALRTYDSGGISLRWRSTETLQESGEHPRTEQKSQSRFKKISSRVLPRATSAWLKCEGECLINACRRSEHSPTTIRWQEPESAGISGQRSLAADQDPFR
jgi:hypothetical protein